MKYGFIDDIQCGEDDPHPVELPDSQVPSNAKKKRKKDKNAPRKPDTAYTCFQKIFYKETKAENPDVSFAEISKLVGAKWKNTSEEEKKEFEKQSEEDKARYNNEMANYIAPPSDEDEPEGKKKKRDPNMPKHPKSAYLFFCEDMRKEIKAKTPGVTFSNWGRELGKRFSKLPAEERQKYDDLCTEDKLRYGEEKAVYSSNKKSNEVEVELSECGKGEKDMVESESSMETHTDSSAQDEPLNPVKTRTSRRKTIQKGPHKKKKKSKNKKQSSSTKTKSTTTQPNTTTKKKRRSPRTSITI